MGQVRTKPPMSMRDFWRELATLSDKGWKTTMRADGQIRLDPTGEGAVRLTPVMALACYKNNDHIPGDLDEACRILNLSFQAGQRIREASINYHGRVEHTKTRQHLLRVLKPSDAV